MISTNDIQNLYIAYFNRPADADAVARWTAGDYANMGVAQLAQEFSHQPEYANIFSGMSTSQTVNTLYNNLFGHNADSSGLAYWVGQVDGGNVTMGQAALAILTGASGKDAAAVAAKLDAANSFTSKLAANPSMHGAYTVDNINNSYGLAKAWLSGVVDASSGAAATANLDSTFAAMADKSHEAIIATPIMVKPGTQSLGTPGKNVFTVTDAILQTAGTVIHGNDGDIVTVTDTFSDASHPAIVTGASTLVLQQGSAQHTADPFLNQFSTINDYDQGVPNSVGGSYAFLNLGSVAQHANLYGSPQSMSVTLGAPNQSVTQGAGGAGAVEIITSHANLAGAKFNIANTMLSSLNDLNLTDGGTVNLDTAMPNNFGAITLDGSENLTLSPVRDMSVFARAHTTNLTSAASKTINVTQMNDDVLHLDGTANYNVTNLGSGSLTDNGTAGTLNVIETTGAHTINSSVATVVNASTIYTGNSNAPVDTLNGSGSFIVNNVGSQANGAIIDGGALNGSLTVNANGPNTSTVTEAGGTGDVMINLGGDGMLNFNTTISHVNTVKAIEGMNAHLALTGNGNVTILGAASGNLTVSGNAGLETINLSATGLGSNNISVSGSTLGDMATKLVTINNFSSSNLSALHLGHAASSLGNIDIASSGLSDLGNQIGAAAGSLSNNDYKAFLVHVDAGAAAGTYVYEHTAGSTVGAGDIIVKLTGTTAPLVATGDLQA